VQQRAQDTVRHGANVLRAALSAPLLGAPYAVSVDESDPAAALGNIIDGTILPDGRIALLDDMTDNVHILGRDARHVATWGRQGQGPEEFESTVHLGAAGDSLLVMDQGGLRASFVAPSGKVVRRTVPRPGASVWARPSADRWVATLMENPRVIVANRLDTIVDHVVILNDSGRIVDSLGRYTHELATLRYDPKMITLIRLPYTPRGNVAVAGRLVAFHTGHDYRIHTVDLATGRRRLITFDSIPAAMTTRLNADILDAAIQRIPAERRATTRRLWENRPRPTRAGGFSKVMVSKSGELWLGLTDSPATTVGGPGAEHWLALDGAGRVVRSISLQPRERLLAIGDTSLVIIAKDADDVQSVRLYRLPPRRS
jgi:hypothetical protein